MIENKRIDNPRITIISVSAKAQDEKKRWNTRSVIFNIHIYCIGSHRQKKSFMCIKKIEYTIVCNISDKESLTEWIS